APRSLAGAASGNLGRVYEYANGDLVRVSRGPFDGFPGRVVGVDGDRLVVDVEVFGRSTPVLLSPEDVVRIDPDEGNGGGGRGQERGGGGGGGEGRETGRPGGGEERGVGREARAAGGNRHSGLPRAPESRRGVRWTRRGQNESVGKYSVNKRGVAKARSLID